MKDFIKINDYIKSFPRDTQALLKKLKMTVNNIVPDAEETISYGMPTFKLNGKNLLHFAGYKNHIGFYPTPSGISAFTKELTKYKTSKGAIQFPIDEKLPLGLITRIVRYRVKESLLTKN